MTSGARLHYGIIKGYLTRAAAKVPEADYPFRPTAGVRTFAQLIGHVADANYRLCSVLAGQEPAMGGNTTTADLVKALEESFAYCDKHTPR